MVRRSVAAAVASIAIMGALWSGAARADIVTNGGFEDGNFTGWTVSDPDGITIDTADPFAGTYDASLGTGGTTGTLSQTLATTHGTTYDISFELQNQDATLGQLPGFVDLLTVAFGGDVLYSSTGILPGPGYNFLSFMASASASSTPLVFTEENDLSVWNLDSVSVQPVSTSVPEPTSALLLLGGIGSWLGARRLRRRR